MLQSLSQESSKASFHLDATEKSSITKNLPVESIQPDLQQTTLREVEETRKTDSQRLSFSNQNSSQASGSSPIIPSQVTSDQVEERKRYNVTSDDQRLKFIELIHSGDKSIKDAAQICGINYSTAKSIVKLLKDQGRVMKKKHRTQNTSYIDKIKTFHLDAMTGWLQQNENLSQIDQQNLYRLNMRNLRTHSGNSLPVQTLLPHNNNILSHSNSNLHASLTVNKEECNNLIVKSPKFDSIQQHQLHNNIGAGVIPVDYSQHINYYNNMNQNFAGHLSFQPNIGGAQSSSIRWNNGDQHNHLVAIADQSQLSPTGNAAQLRKDEYSSQNQQNSINDQYHRNNLVQNLQVVNQQQLGSNINNPSKLNSLATLISQGGGPGLPLFQKEHGISPTGYEYHQMISQNKGQIKNPQYQINSNQSVFGLDSQRQSLFSKLVHKIMNDDDIMATSGR
eukprot:403348704